MTVSDTFLKLILKGTAIGLLIMIIASWTFGSTATLSAVDMIEQYSVQKDLAYQKDNISNIKHDLGMQAVDYKIENNAGKIKFIESVPYNFQLRGIMKDTEWLLIKQLTQSEGKMNLVYKQPHG